MYPKPPLSHRGVLRRIPLRPQDMTSHVTATKDLFTLTHLGIPQTAEARWSVAVDGLVDRPSSFTMAQLKALPWRVIEAVHECAGNPMQPQIPQRRVVNVRWGGVPLRSILNAVGARQSGRYLWSYGADHGEFAEVACDAFVKDLPLDLIDPDAVLLAYEVNGEPLPQENGYPLRLVVPGFYGTNCVKWLYRMTLADRRADSPFTTRFYNDTTDGKVIPVWAVAPESLIVHPAPGTILAAGVETLIWGWAWAYNAIATVDVTVDGSKWSRARLSDGTDRGWQRFEFSWRPRYSTPAIVSSRATDTIGAMQPMTGARNAIHSVHVTVRESPSPEV